MEIKPIKTLGDRWNKDEIIIILKFYTSVHLKVHTEEAELGKSRGSAYNLVPHPPSYSSWEPSSSRKGGTNDSSLLAAVMLIATENWVIVILGPMTPSLSLQRHPGLQPSCLLWCNKPDNQMRQGCLWPQLPITCLHFAPAHSRPWGLQPRLT